jgi:hypothetical protein
MGPPRRAGGCRRAGGMDNAQLRPVCHLPCPLGVVLASLLVTLGR